MGSRGVGDIYRVDPREYDCTVASRAEAWIETIALEQSRDVGCVASRAEAWIETTNHDSVSL